MTSGRTNKSAGDIITRFTNCLLVNKNGLVESDLFVNSTTGLIISPQDSFYKNNATPTRTIDLGGRILSPGFIDVQLNGACGFDFSVIPGDGSEAAMVEYEEGLKMANKGIVKTGVTSYLPTLITQRKEVYARAIPRLAAPPSSQRIAFAGAESLGVHCEGPFLNPERNGIHSKQILQHPSADLASLEDVYNASSLQSSLPNTPPAVKMITIAPELLSQPSAITSTLQSRGIVLSAGHSTATYEQLLASNITMTTHLFNAMDQLQQRAPGIPGVVLGEHSQTRYYGIISDGIHVHPANINLAYRSNSEGCILVTDAMRWAGLEDGVYDWTNNERIIKRGNLLVLEGTDKIAGSSATLPFCLNNFLKFTSTPLVPALATVTSTPAKMLGLEGKKGILDIGADADLCVLSVSLSGMIEVDEVWKFGVKVHERERQPRTKQRNGRILDSRL